MRLLKWTAFFVVSFFISWVVIGTFSQVEFRMKAPARIIMYTTAQIPIYYFIVGAFLLGLGLGLAVAAYNFISLKARSFKTNGEARRQDEEIARLTAGLQECERQRQEAESKLALSSEEATGGERLLDEGSGEDDDGDAHHDDEHET
jgi:hypothetical protein